MSMELKPTAGNDLRYLPLGFDAANDFTRGDAYVDEYGYNLSASEINERLENEGGGEHRVVASFQFRNPNDALNRFTTEIVIRDAMGPLDADSLARMVHEMARSIYNGLTALQSNTPAEVFVNSISVNVA